MPEFIRSSSGASHLRAQDHGVSSLLTTGIGSLRIYRTVASVPFPANAGARDAIRRISGPHHRVALFVALLILGAAPSSPALAQSTNLRIGRITVDAVPLFNAAEASH